MTDDQDEVARVRRQVTLHGEASLNRLDAWRWKNICAADERAERRKALGREERRAEERAQQRTTADELRSEMARLRAEVHQLHDALIEATGEAIGQFTDKAVDRAERAIKDIQRETLTLVEKGFAEPRARLDVSLPEAQSRATKDFKFSSERDDAEIDLPNPLAPRGVIRKTTLN
jgi:hypothetical protein